MSRFLVGLAVFMCLSLGATGAQAERRVALVIGNSAYRHATPLANPKNDAADMTEKLEELGFEVVSGLDLDLAGMRSTVRDFIGKLGAADMALFFYAGHGLQVNGENYMAPIDAQLASYIDLDFEAMPINLIMSAMERNTRVNLVFLDACRDNPLAENLARSMGTRSGAVGRGLAKLGSGVGSLIAFATQPGNVALDGTGRNSPFTTALLRHLGTPGQGVTDELILVRRDVLEATGGKQVPWDNSSLTGKVVLVPAAGDTPAVAALPPSSGSAAQVELSYWDTIKDSTDKTFFEAYLQRWPQGEFADLAKLKIESLRVSGAVETARLAPSNSEPTEVGSEPEDQVGFARAVQTELNRLGCSVGRVDGIWGAASRRALEQFARRQGVRLASLDPTDEVLGRLKSTSERVCPLVCARGSEERNGKCEPLPQQANVEPSAKSERQGSAQPETSRPTGGNSGLAGTWMLTASCSWGSGQYPIHVSQDNQITGSVNGNIRGGRISGRNVSFSSSNALNTARYVGSVESSSSMRGTMTQSLSSETCTWFASR